MEKTYYIKPANGKIRPAIRIAKSLGIDVKLVGCDILDGCSGMTVNFGEKKGKPFAPVIFISDDLSLEECDLTLLHELAHIFLGHLLSDERFAVPYNQAEFEAEALGFILYNFLYGIDGSRTFAKASTDHNRKKQLSTMTMSKKAVEA